MRWLRAVDNRPGARRQCRQGFRKIKGAVQVIQARRLWRVAAAAGQRVGSYTAGPMAGRGRPSHRDNNGVRHGPSGGTPAHLRLSPRRRLLLCQAPHGVEVLAVHEADHD